MKKILILNFGDIAHTFQGGQERNLFTVINELKKNNWNFTLVLPQYGKTYEKFHGAGIKTCIFPIRGILFFLGLFKLIKLIIKEKYDIIQTEDCRSNLFGFISSKLTGIGTLIAFRHDVYLNKKTMSKFLLIKKVMYKFVDKIIFQFYSQIVAVSIHIANELVNKLHVPGEKIKIIPCGIEIKKFSKIPIKKYSKKEFIIGCISRIEPSKKGQHILIKAIPFIRKNFNNIKIYFIGDDRDRLKEKTKLQNIANKSHAANNIKFIPYKEDITGILKKVDLIVQPSLYEGLPISMIEALASGKPVIASKIGGINELIVNGKNGFLVQPGNHEMLAKKIIYLLKNKALLKKMAHNARKNIKKFDIKTNTFLVEKLYREI